MYIYRETDRETKDRQRGRKANRMEYNSDIKKGEIVTCRKMDAT